MKQAPDCKNGYILLARKLGNNFLMEKPPLWLKLWIWMLLGARFRDGNGLKRGQFFTSIDEMREAMTFKIGYRKERPTRDQIRNAYEAFAKATMITTTKTTRGMIITICNYDKYQNPSNYEAHSEDHNENTTKTQHGPHYNRRRGNQEKKEKSFNKPKNQGGGSPPYRFPVCPHCGENGSNIVEGHRCPYCNVFVAHVSYV